MDRYSLAERFGIWFAYTTCLPVLFIGMAWGIEKYFLHAEHPIADTFGSGDLLPLAAVLLLGIAAEIVANKLNAGWMLFHQLVFTIVSVGLAMGYGAMKTRGIEYLRAGDDLSYCELRNFSEMSFGVIVYAAIHSTFAKLLLERKIARALYG
jgi:hypothetical protein